MFLKEVFFKTRSTQQNIDDCFTDEEIREISEYGCCVVIFDDMLEIIKRNELIHFSKTHPKDLSV